MVDGAEPAQLVWWIVVAPWHPAQLDMPHPRQCTKWFCLLSFFGRDKIFRSQGNNAKSHGGC